MKSKKYKNSQENNELRAYLKICKIINNDLVGTLMRKNKVFDEFVSDVASKKNKF